MDNEPTPAPITAFALDPFAPVPRPERPVDHHVLPEHPLLTIIGDPGRAKWRAVTSERKRHGQAAIATEDELRQAFADYAASLDHAAKWATKRKDVNSDDGDTRVTEATPMHAPPFINGFCAFMGVSRQAWSEWRDPNSDRHREDLAAAIADIEAEIKATQVAMASSGLGNGNVLTRLAGLADKQEIKQKGAVKVDTTDALAAIKARLEPNAAPCVFIFQILE